jgi:hypothetical protein
VLGTHRGRIPPTRCEGGIVPSSSGNWQRSHRAPSELWSKQTQKGAHWWQRTGSHFSTLCARGQNKGIFPNREVVLRLFGAMLAEQNDEWLVRRHYFSKGSMRKLYEPPAAEGKAELMKAWNQKHVKAQAAFPPLDSLS